MQAERSRTKLIAPLDLCKTPGTAQRIASYMATKTLQTIRNSAIALRGGMDDYDTLLEFIGNARFVLIGEASHGTHEFYRRRAEITQRLITEKGFQGVAAFTGYTVLYTRVVLMRMPTKRWESSAAFPHGCGATPTCWISSAGCAITMTI